MTAGATLQSMELTQCQPQSYIATFHARLRPKTDADSYVVLTIPIGLGATGGCRCAGVVVVVRECDGAVI